MSATPFTRRKFLISTAAAASSAWFLAACGGGGDGNNAPAAPQSASQVPQADIDKAYQQRHWPTSVRNANDIVLPSAVSTPTVLHPA